jgi:hypothetical protein
MIEHKRGNEILYHISGIAIVTKTMASGCPLAEMIARSGIEKVLPQLTPVLFPDLSSDFQTVLTGGDFKFINPYTNSLSRNSFDIMSGPENTLNVGLPTLMTDNYGRETPIQIGFKGLKIHDRESLWMITLKLFPSLQFQVSQNKVSFDDINRLAEDNIVPLPSFDLSDQLPTVNIDRTPVAKLEDEPKIERGNIRLSTEEVERVKRLLDEYRGENYIQGKFRVLRELATIIPGFSSVREKNQVLRLANAPEEHCWTWEEVERLLENSISNS